MPKQEGGKAHKKRAAAAERIRSAFGDFGLKEGDEKTWASILDEIHTAAHRWRVLSEIAPEHLAVRPNNVREELLVLEKAADALVTALASLSDPAMEWLFDCRPLYTRPSEPGARGDGMALRNLIFRAKLAEYGLSEPDIIGRHVMFALEGDAREYASNVAELAREASTGFCAAWPDDGGGKASPLIGTPRQRLAHSLIETIHSVLGRDACLKVSGTPSGRFAKLLKAVTEYVTGEEAPDSPDVLNYVPRWRDEIVGRADTATRREQAGQERAAKMESARLISEARRISESATSNLADIDCVLPRLAAVKGGAGADLVTKLLRLRNDFTEPQQPPDDGKWVKKSLAISGQPRSRD